MKSKICTKCGKRKPLSGFYCDCTKKDGLKTYCKDCANEMNNSYRKNGKARKRLDESKKAFKKAVEDEVANRKAVSAKTAKGNDIKPKKEELEAVIFVSNMIKSVVQAIAGNFGFEAVCLVKLKPKTK